MSAGAGTTAVSATAPAAQVVQAVTTAPKTVSSVTTPVKTTTTTVTQAVAPAVSAVSSVTSTISHGSDGRSTTTTTFVPAPDSKASATGLAVNIIDTCVSCTNTDSGQNKAQANGVAVRLLGTDVSSGSSSGNGAPNSGNLIAVPIPSLLALAVADWETSTSYNATSSTSHARAALVDLSLADGKVLTLSVLRSTSDTTWTGAVSQGKGSNDGAALDLGQGALVIILLHSEGSSSGTGSAYVVSINGNEILTSGQTGGIPITIPGVTTINLLIANASGGNGFGTSSGSGTVGQISDTVGLGAGQNLLALGATGVGSKMPAAGTPPTAAATCPPACPKPPITASPGPTAPLTGAALGLGGLILIGTGLATVALGHRARGGRRRRRSRS
jgi:hypothetical protein